MSVNLQSHRCLFVNLSIVLVDYLDLNLMFSKTIAALKTMETLEHGLVSPLLGQSFFQLEYFVSSHMFSSLRGT